jgi:DUF2075 family protein
MINNNGMPIGKTQRQAVLKTKDNGLFDEAKELIRNHYHILLTRGKKGCYYL